MKKVFGLILLLCAALCVNAAAADVHVHREDGTRIYRLEGDQTAERVQAEEEPQDESGIEERASIGKPVLTGPSTALTNESFTLTATMPGATKFRWFYNNGIENNRYSWEYTNCKGKSEDQNSYTFETKARFAVKAYKDGTWSEFSDVLEVEIQAPYGPIPLPEMEPLPFEILAGQDVRIVAKKGENASESVVGLSERREDGDWYWIWEKEIDDSGITIIPGNLISEGKDYEINLLYSGVGYEDNYIYKAYFNVKKTSSIETDDRISVPETTVRVLTEQSCELTFCADDALAWALYQYDEWSNRWECMRWMTDLPLSVEIDESPTLTEEQLRQCVSGRILKSDIYAGDTVGMEYYCVRAYLPTGWTKPSPIVKVMAIAPYGRLGNPQIELIGKLEVGKPVTVAYTLPPHTESYSIVVSKEDEYVYNISEHGDFSEGKKGKYTFPAQFEQWHYNPETDESECDLVDLITGENGTRYELTISVFAPGYKYSQDGKEYYVGETAPIRFDLILPDDLVEIEASAFEGDSSITTVKCPAGLKKIGARAFANCESLTLIQAPAGAEIEASAFEECDEELVIERY